MKKLIGILRSVGSVILLIIGLLFCVILFAVILRLIQAFLFVPKDYLMWTVNPPGKYVFFIIAFLISDLWLKLFHEKKTKPVNKKNLILASIITVVLLYVQITSVSVFTGEEIINYSFIHPVAKEYLYTDISSVQTGVYGNDIPIVRDKGDFYYIVTFDDGTKINLMDMSGEASHDTYSQIENIDKIIMSKGVKKISSEDNIELVQLDKTYIERFKRIIRNK
jgi:hypothetical protein